MKKVAFILSFLLVAVAAFAQRKPSTFPVKTTAGDLDAIYSQEDGADKKILFATARKYFLPLVNPILRDTAPPATGNTTLLGQMVTVESTGAVYYIDGAGRSIRLGDVSQADLDTVLQVALAADSLYIILGAGADPDTLCNIGGYCVTLPIGERTEAGFGLYEVGDTVHVDSVIVATEWSLMQMVAEIRSEIEDSSVVWRDTFTDLRAALTAMAGDIAAIEDSLQNIPDGIGTANYLPKWQDANTLTNSLLYDNGTNVGLGTTSPASKLEVQTNNIGTTQTNTSGLLLSSATPALSGAQQISPAIRFRGFGWGTTAGTSQSTDWRMDVLPVQGTVPTSLLRFQSSVNNALYNNSNSVTFGSNGTLGVGTQTAYTSGSVRMATSTDATITSGWYNVDFVLGGYTHDLGVSNGGGYIDFRKISGGTVISRIHSNGNSYLMGGNVGIGNASPTARLYIQAPTNTEDGTRIIDVRRPNLGEIFNFTDQGKFTTGNGLGFYPSQDGGTSILRASEALFVGSSIAGVNTSGLPYVSIGRPSSLPNSSTAGNPGSLQVVGAFAPTSGSATIKPFHVKPVINQTGTASGAVIGLDYDPIVTSILGPHYGLLVRAGNVGIGVSSPTEKLEVAGKTKTTTFQLTTGATNNYYLKSDASGNGTWASLPAGDGNGLISTLPNSSVTIDADENELEIINTGYTRFQSIGTIDLESDEAVRVTASSLRVVNPTSQASLRLYSNGGFWNTISAAPSLATSPIFRLPPTNGFAKQILLNTGPGVAEWAWLPRDTVDLSLSAVTANALNLNINLGEGVVVKGSSGIGLAQSSGTKDTLYIYTVEHFGMVTSEGGSTFSSAGSPVTPDDDTPGTRDATLSSEYTQSGGTINYTGAAGVVEIGAVLSFTADTSGDYLVSIFQEGVEVAETEIRISVIATKYAVAVLPEVPVAADQNDTFSIRIEPVSGSGIVITPHRYTIKSRKIY